MQKILDSPDLETILNAIGLYRHASMSKLGCDPKRIGNVSDDNEWLVIWR